MITNVEIKTIEHEGINVSILINYDEGTMSLVEKRNGFGDGHGYKTKDYKFAGRTTDYANGWKNILDAMKVAIDYGKTELDKRQEERIAAIEKALISSDDF